MTTTPDFPALFMAAAAPMLVVAPDAPRFTIVEVNQAYLAATMRTHDDLVGRGLFEAMPDNPDDPGTTGESNLRASIERAIAGRRVDQMVLQKYDIPRPGGGFEERWWDPVNTPVLSADGVVTAIIHQVADATGRVHAEAALHRSEAALRTLNKELEQRVEERTRELHESQDFARLALSSVGGVGAWTHDVASDLFFCSPAISELYGLDPVRGTAGIKRTAFLANVHPDDLPRLRAVMAGGLTRDGDIELEYRIRHPDGSIRWVLSRGHTYADEDGRMVRRVGFGIDTTRQREMEEQLRQSQKMEAVGQLTGGLAHDFNNLLAGISGSLELMNARIAQGRLKDVDRYMVAAQGAARRAAALTHRLLAFSRRQTLEPKATNVVTLTDGMLDLIRRTVGPGVAVEVAAAPELWLTLVDPSQLENALLNLCINARDAMPEGGRITIEATNRNIDGHAARRQGVPEGEFVSLCVADTGTGMPPEVIAKAFDPFFTTKPLGQGTGLGLSMIYGFVQQSGGQVRIHSQVGQGTNVCLYLPRHQGEAEGVQDVRTEALRSVAEAGETVLVVDDEPTVRMLVADVLGDLGYTAVEVADGASALKVLQSNARIDLLITDVGLPGGLNGRQVADAARAGRPGLKVLFITGYAENALLNDGQLEPGMAVLTKPFPVDTLAAHICELIKSTDRLLT